MPLFANDRAPNMCQGRTRKAVAVQEDAVSARQWPYREQRLDVFLEVEAARLAEMCNDRSRRPALRRLLQRLLG